MKNSHQIKSGKIPRNEEDTFAERAVNFFFNLIPARKLISPVKIMNPYKSKEVREVIKEFFVKFYNDKNERIFILGINPGRFGGGITGISFTDPIRLEENCGIKNSFEKKPELSSKFFYEVINAYGGAAKFYSRYYVSALYPLALIKNGKNYNYYESKKLFNQLKTDIKLFLQKQFQFGAKKNYVISLGRKNAEFLRTFNNELSLFNKIITLDHPRYIMQYKMKSAEFYISEYLKFLQ